MSLFSSPLCVPEERNFTPLFRLLDDFDSYKREAQGTQNTTARRPSPRGPAPLTFKPKFDVRETETTFELHGELPGIERENLHIEFTEPQTIVIRGRIERTYGSKPDHNTTTAANGEQQSSASGAAGTASNSHRVTVEDDPEEVSTTSTPVDTPKTDSAKPATSSTEVRKAGPADRGDGAKVWVWERSVGEFSRTFSFPSRVEQDGVTASLDNGVLTVTVPKSKKYETRRIAIN